MTRVGAERALLAELDGSCKTPIAGLAELEVGRTGQRVRLSAGTALATQMFELQILAVAQGINNLTQQRGKLFPAQ